MSAAVKYPNTVDQTIHTPLSHGLCVAHRPRILLHITHPLYSIHACHLGCRFNDLSLQVHASRHPYSSCPPQRRAEAAQGRDQPGSCPLRPHLCPLAPSRGCHWPGELLLGSTDMDSRTARGGIAHAHTPFPPCSGLSFISTKSHTIVIVLCKPCLLMYADPGGAPGHGRGGVFPWSPPV